MTLEFLNALRFLSIIPVPWDEEIDVEKLGKASAWFPLVGAVLGGLLLFVHGVAGIFFQPAVCSAVVVVVWIILTRGFHLDGLADTFDGLGGGATKETRLAIMKDSRLGTFGVLAILCVLLLKFAVLDELKWQFFSKTLILAPILGRWVMLIGIRFFPSARPGGMGDIFSRSCTNREVIIGTVSAIALAVLLSGFYGLIFMVLSGCVAYFMACLLSRALGGLTGDSYGALCEIGELTTLLTASFIMRLFISGY
jgi:adenosylcobinamide-GDP ribazoletransferase